MLSKLADCFVLPLCVSGFAPAAHAATANATFMVSATVVDLGLGRQERAKVLSMIQATLDGVTTSYDQSWVAQAAFAGDLMLKPSTNIKILAVARLSERFVPERPASWRSCFYREFPIT